MKNIKLITTAKSAAITAVLLSFALLLAACAEGGGDAPLGVITLNLSGIAADSANARAAYPPGPAELAKIKYTVELQGASYIKVETKQGEHNVSIKAPAGQYRVTVTAYLNGAVYAVGFVSAAVEVGKPNSVTITMRNIEFTGSSIPTFKAWYDALPANTPETAYKAKLNVSTLGSYTIGPESSTPVTVSELAWILMSAYEYGKNIYIYIDLDLSGSTFTRIDEKAFFSCFLITGIILPNGLTSIGDAAFGCCSGITSIIIPASVTKIERYAFERCANLTSVTFAGSLVTDFGDNAFHEAGELGGDSLKNAYLGVSPAPPGGAGTYTRPANGTTWTKKP